MGTSVTIRTEGFAELERALAELGDVRTRRAVATRAARKALAPMAEKARALAPVADGHLRDSIKVGTKASGATAGGRAFSDVLRSGGTRAEAVQAMRDAKRATASQVIFHMGPGRHPQAITQEFGTIFHPPQPYMRPAWDSESKATLERIKDELWADITRTARRLEARARRAAARAAAGG